MKTLDVLFINGDIHTMEGPYDVVESLGMKDGIIVFVGTNEEGKKRKTRKTIDLKGKTMIPGLVDAHLHFYAYCQTGTFVDLQGAKSMEEVTKRLRDKIKEEEDGQWIIGVHFDQSKFPIDILPTKKELDKISKMHPILIRRSCLHTAIANSKALEKAGIGDHYVFSGGGTVELDQEGHPTGILREQSISLMDKILPDPLENKEKKHAIMGKGFEKMSAWGITSIHTYGAAIWNYLESVEEYRHYERRGELPLRISIYQDYLFDHEEDWQEKKKDVHSLVQLEGYKIFTDGSLGSKSAALIEDYCDDKGNRGILVNTEEELREKVLEGLKRNLQLAIHAIGDRALKVTLEAIERGIKTLGKEPDLPIRLIHVQMVNEEIMEKMKTLPVVLDIQPSFLCTDLYWIEDRIGKKRCEMAYNWKTLHEMGFTLAGGSDSPVESFNPFKGIFAAAERTSEVGEPKGGFYPKEKLSRYESVKMFTRNPHFATGDEERIGLLKEGYFADITILEKNIFTCSPTELLHMQVNSTYCGGKKVY